ncbi:MAG: hypothetical protein GC190_15855 [Alphaproteobacteria bacterium]|nr:hypothetical protein [Alphaproteobacteria bacterium]
MRTTPALALIVSFALVFIAIPASANMPPPEPFKLGITGRLNNEGLLLTSVEKGSKADEHGLRNGDVILAADHIYAKSMSPKELKEVVEGLHVWKVELVVLRNGRDVTVLEIRA